ncbi:L-gulonolactone oxidase 3 [Macadamia integrifolia]|uniref:L-gulonolactone oxidase 3 n=1 Tax=Macadamia integrifolia TaxID=60698 RepID=UPI001C4F9744|nr:L-gulonolactone oxidase 3 [Macadamia integrifolia]
MGGTRYHHHHHLLFLHGLLLVLVIWVTTQHKHSTHAMPPPPPTQCNATGCILSNCYGIWNDRNDCWVPKILYPTTEDELLSAVAYANRNKLKLKVVWGSHTIPKLACPGTSSPGNALLISTANYNSSVVVDVADLSVTSDAGVSLRHLIDKVEEAGFSLVPSPYWEGASVAGIISTGSHGSSWWGKGGSVHDHVLELSLVVPATESQGHAKILRLNAQDPLFNAAIVSMGMLGVVSKVKLSLEPRFKRSITYNFTDDAQFEDEFMDHARRHEFADITWYASRHTAVYRYDDRVPLNSNGDGVYDFLGFQPNPVPVSTTVRAVEKAFEAAKNVNGKCTMAASFVGYKKLIANGLKNNKQFFTGYPVVGYQGKMQTSGSCLYSPAADTLSSCAWDPRIKGLFFYETTAIFPASKFADFIRDVKKLRDLKPENFCGVDIYNGFLIRFIKASGAYLGQTEDSVVVDFNYYRADEASTSRLNQDVWEEVEQMAFFKYGARPHWAKNRNLAFVGVQAKYPNFNKFLAAKKQLDPQNIFSSYWSDEILIGKEAAKGEGCALEGQCVCSEDRHCNPSKGYFCKPGLIYTVARVCRYSPSSMA